MPLLAPLHLESIVVLRIVVRGLRRFFRNLDRVSFYFLHRGRSLGATDFHRELFVLVAGSPHVGDPATPRPDPNLTRSYPVGDPARPLGGDPVILRASSDETRPLPLLRDFEFPLLYA